MLEEYGHYFTSEKFLGNKGTVNNFLFAGLFTDRYSPVNSGQQTQLETKGTLCSNGSSAAAGAAGWAQDCSHFS